MEKYKGFIYENQNQTIYKIVAHKRKADTPNLFEVTLNKMNAFFAFRFKHFEW